MSIEMGPPRNEAKSASVSDAKLGKSKGAGAGAKGGAPATGFMAVLAAMDPGGGASSGLPAVAVDAKSKSMPHASETEVDPKLTPSHLVGGEDASAMSRASAFGEAAEEEDAIDAALNSLLPLPIDGGDRPPIGNDAQMQANALLLSARPAASAAPHEVAAPMSKKAKSAASSAMAALGGIAAEVPSAQSVTVSATPAVQPLATTDVGKNTVTPVVQAPDELAADMAAAAPAVGSFAEAIRVQRRADGEVDAAAVKSLVVDGAAGAGVAEPVGGVGAPVSETGSVDTYVAEQIKYWISNDVQSAEMSLDGLGQEAVEVSIRMHGNEAHVDFRTDELAARAALESAGGHLRDLLQREGLVLSGLSIGQSRTSDAQQQDRREQEGARQGRVKAVVPAEVASAQTVGRRGASGQSLDLFV